jgi:DNA (cytosine-5)-methyltransferase 1
VNHWPVAVATHAANHPEARHLCTAIDDIDPRKLFKPSQLDMLWASPECTHHSIARGGRPISDQSRATAWCVIRWADALLPPVIMVENVPEFATWGPLDSKLRPIEKRKGELFHSWLRNLEALGYRTDWRILCAADYGDPTTRKRLFVQAVRGRRRIAWPEPSHSPKGDDLFSRPKWRAAREIIDWALPSQSIYERKKALSPKTMRRIMAGLEKFGVGPYLVTTTHGNSGKVNAAQWNAHDLDKPLGAVTSATEKALVQPYLVELRGTSPDTLDRSGRNLAEPLSTVTTSGAHHALVEPFIVQVAHGNAPTEKAPDLRRSKSIDSPLPTVKASGGDFGLAQPYLVKLAHTDLRSSPIDAPLPTVVAGNPEWCLCEPALLPQQSDGALRPVSAPCPTVATAGAIGLVEPFLVSYYGTGGASSVEEPLDTVTTKHRHALVRPVIEIKGQRYQLDIRFRMLQPHELAQAQGFPADYQFTGTKTEQIKQIGNAVPCGLARALVSAVLNPIPSRA